MRREQPSLVPEVWGILNVTPDSFSDGGEFFNSNAAIDRGLEMIRDGASVVDVGGESTRPRGPVYGSGSVVVPAEEELRRVLPVMRALVANGVRVSIDTTKPVVARAALELGARIINDVSCGADPTVFALAREFSAEYVLMHNRARGAVTESTARYENVVADVAAELERVLARVLDSGVPRARIWIDPGLGFAKTAEQSRDLLAGVGSLRSLGCRILVGASRKAFLSGLGANEVAQESAPSERIGESIAAALHASASGARAVRVHDVRETVRALAVAEEMYARAGAVA